MYSFMEYLFYIHISVLVSYVFYTRSENETFNNDVNFNLTFAEVDLTDILQSKVVLNGPIDNNISEYLNDTKTHDLLDEDYVDFSALHPDEAQQLYRTAMSKQKIAEMEFNKTIERQLRQSPKPHPPLETYLSNPFVVAKAMDLMTQSVYATRRRLQDTRPLRLKMTKRSEYSFALLYGSLMQIRIKMDNLYTTMKKFNPRETKFMWYLVLYERCLSFNMDVTNLVKEIFDISKKYAQLVGMDDEGTGVMDVVPPWASKGPSGR